METYDLFRQVWAKIPEYSIGVLMTARILIVDDRDVVRSELHHVLELSEGIIVAGEAADGLEALRQAALVKPDVVLMDLEMPGMDGFEAIHQIKAQHLARAVIVLTIYADAFNQKKAMDAGADAFIAKGADLGAIMELIEQFSSRP